MATFIYNKKIVSVLAVLFWVSAIALFLLNIASFAFIMLVPTVLPWSYTLLMISFLLIFLSCVLFILSKKAQWKSRLFIVLLFFSVSNSIISAVVFYKSNSIKENSDQAKETLNKALQEINKKLQDSVETK